MGSKNVVLLSSFFVLASLMILSTTSSGFLNIKVYANNNCDTTSTCKNVPDTPTQRNSCARFSDCGNSGNGNSNTQNNNCDSTFQCNNFANGNSNTQNTVCRSSTLCENIANGNSNTQNTVCQSSTICGSVAIGNSNTQNTVCQSSTDCSNDESNANVYSNSASCSSNGHVTTTLCQPGRTFTFSNH